MADIKPLSHGAPTDTGADKRRTQRVQIAMPVIARGKSAGQNFDETTTTVTVNAHGAMLLLQARVARGDKVTILNPKTTEEMPCTVVFIGQREGTRTQVGVEFAEPSRIFWRINFPPEDWNPSQRKKAGPLPSSATSQPKKPA
ncbi:MAG: PilZ domain-containing protein [Candidatus Acidiferrales bacterium]